MPTKGLRKIKSSKKKHRFLMISTSNHFVLLYVYNRERIVRRKGWNESLKKRRENEINEMLSNNKLTSFNAISR